MYVFKVCDKNNKNTFKISLNLMLTDFNYKSDNKMILLFQKKSVYLQWIYGKIMERLRKKAFFRTGKPS